MGIAIIVVDMINDFVTGELGISRAKDIIPNIKKLLDFARAKGVPIIYACDSHSRDDAEVKLWGPHAIAGSKGAEIVEELKPREGDVLVKKSKYSPFFGTDLDRLLRDLGVTELVLVGVSTDICILHTAADAFYRGYGIFVPSDCVEAFTREDHERALEYMRRVYGAKIVSSDELIRSLRG
ncbi:MAG: isochorismatase family cysteine hydrolase [Candidatus Hadarchaeales archaeon]